MTEQTNPAEPAFDDPDQALPTEDDNPEALAGGPVDFDPDADPDADPSPETPADGAGPGGNA